MLSLVVLIYFIFASGPSHATRSLPWFILGQLVLDIVFFIFWLSAAATSTYSCNDLCEACHIWYGYVLLDDFKCTCYKYKSSYRRDYSHKPGNVLHSRITTYPSEYSGSKSFKTAGKIAARHASDTLMTYA